MSYFYNIVNNRILRLLHADENGALFEQKNSIMVYYDFTYIKKFIIKVNKIHLAMEYINES